MRDLAAFISQGNYIAPERLDALARIVVLNSRFPMHFALQTAHLVHKIARKFIMESGFAEVALRFSKLARRLLDGIESDIIASIVLEQHNEDGASVLQLAVK